MSDETRYVVLDKDGDPWGSSTAKMDEALERQARYTKAHPSAAPFTIHPIGPALEAEPSAAERIAELERTLADAERRASEAANRKAYERCREMMIEATPLGVDEAPFEAWLSRVFPEFHAPAVPPEREGARRSRQCESCGHHAQAHEGNECRATNCLCDRYRPTPPQAAPENTKPPTPEPWANCFAYEVNIDGKMCDVLFTDALCQRIVETGRRASGREG